MKLVNKNAKANLILLRFVFCAMIVFLYSCGNGGGSGDSSSGTGTVSFRLTMQDAGTSPARYARAAGDSEIEFECSTEDYEISTIEAQVFDENGELIAEGGPWDCEDRQGTLSDVEAGDGRIVKIFARDASGNILFGGVSGPITVIANQTVNAGEIDLFPAGSSILAEDDPAATDEDSEVIIPVDENDTESYFNETFNEIGSADPGSLTIEDKPINGTAVANGDGTVSYTPNPDFFGQDSFTYTVQDDLGVTSNSAEVTVTVNPQDDPVVAVDDPIVSGTFATNEDTPLSTGNVLDNDRAVDGGLAVVPGTVTSTHGASVTLAADGTFSYDPTGAAALQALAQGAILNDTFSYTARDVDGDTASATVTVVVTGVDDPVSAADDPSGFATNEDTPLAAGNVLDNDSAADGGLAVVPGPVSSTHGALVTLAADGTFNYNPTTAPAIQALAQGATLADTFSYTARDVDGDTDSATVTVIVTGVNDLTIAVNDPSAPGAFATNEDTPLATGNVRTNDSAADGGLAVVPGTVSSAHGASVTLAADGTFNYDSTGAPALQALAEGATLNDTFTYTATDVDGDTASATVTVIVTGVDDPVIAVDDPSAPGAFATDEDTPLTTGDVLGNDSAADGGLAVVPDTVSSANGASVILSANGTFSYDPTNAPTLQLLAEGAILNDTFTYTARDVDGDTDSATVTVIVTGVDDPVIAADDPSVSGDFATNEDTPLPGVGLLGNDSAADGGLAVVPDTVTSASGATVTLSADGTFNYDPTNAPAIQALAEGEALIPPDTFTYTATDDDGDTDSATVTVSVTGVDDGVIAGDDPSGFATDEDTPLPAGGLLANDSAADGGLAVVPETVSSANGASVILSANGTFSYDPTNAPTLQLLAEGAILNDTFTYTARDVDGDTDSATVTVIVTGVDDPVIAADDPSVSGDFATNEDTPLPGVGLLGNDSAADGGLAVVPDTVISANGATVTLSADGTFNYDPTNAPAIQVLAEGATLNDTFTYTATDVDGDTASATVTVSVTGVDDGVIAGDDPSGFATDEDTPLPGVGLLGNDSAADGGLAVVPDTVTSASGATVTLSADGTFSYDPTNAPAIQALAEGEALIPPDTFTYTATDVDGDTDSATVTVSVTGVDDGVIAGDDPSGFATNEDTPLPGVGLLGNDSAADGGLAVVPDTVTSASGATVTLAVDGTFGYDPTAAPAIQALAEGATLPDTFTYTATDVDGDTDSATVTVIVTGVDDPVVAVDDPSAPIVFATDEDTPLGNNVLLNDRAADGGLAVAVPGTLSSANGASVTLSADGIFNYDPTGSPALQLLLPGETLPDTFTYTARDVDGDIDSATVTVIVTGRTDETIVVDDPSAPGAFATDEDTPLVTGNVLDNDSAADGGLAVVPGTVSSVNGASVTLAADGTFSYDPIAAPSIQLLAQGAILNDTFTYTARDVDNDTATATVTVVVTGVDDPVVAVDDPNAPIVFVTDEDTPLSAGGLLANDSAADGGLAVVPETKGTALGGAVTLFADGTFNYFPGGLVPALGGPDTFSYTASDIDGDTDTATVIVDIIPINDQPVAQNDTIDDVPAFSLAYELDVLSNDDDPVEGDPLIIIDVDSSTAQGGTVTINGAGDRLLYTPVAGFFGQDTFTYTIEDVPGGTLIPGTDTANVTVNVTAGMTRVSVDFNGNDAGNDSYLPAISSDGRYVAFGSEASDLVASDTNGQPDVFVYDRQLERTTLVSIHSDGSQGDNDSGLINIEGVEGGISISADGRFVAFESIATNLVADDTNGYRDIFVHDRDADVNGIFDETENGARSTVRVSVDLNPRDADLANADGESYNPSISGDGRYVAFESWAPDLVADDTNGFSDIFVFDRDPSSLTTQRVSVDLIRDDQDLANADSDSYNPSISGDGRYVAFESWASDLVAGDTNGFRDIFVFDRDPGSLTTQRVSVDLIRNDQDLANANDSSYNPSMSDDGRFVAFESWAPDLVAGDTNGLRDIFVFDRDPASLATQRVSVDTNPGDLDGANADDDSYNPSISGDGRYVAFESWASDLVAGDTNGLSDIFVFDRNPGSLTTARVSVDTNPGDADGGNANGDSFHPAISGDGRFVAFDSDASDLVDDDTNIFWDVFEAPNPFFIP